MRFLPILLIASGLLVGNTAAQEVSDLYRISHGTSDAHVEYHPVHLAPGTEMVLADLAGPGKITYFYITDDSYASPTQGTGLSYPGLVLKIFWDDSDKPSIDMPLWDFFGSFRRETIDFQSSVIQINHRCYMSYLPMPFSKNAKFVLANDGDEEFSRVVAYGIDYEKDPKYATEKSRLHSAWNRSNPTRNAMHTLFETQGAGQYIGNILQVNTAYEGWWGEGDTIFTIDGKQITHTPGTEDEYGSAWEFDHTYSYLYSGYIHMDSGRHRMYRWYVANPVRFQKSLKVEIQNQRWFSDNQVPSSDDYTSVAFWYQEGVHAAPDLMRYSDRVSASRLTQYPRSR